MLCAEWESYLIVHVWSRAVAIPKFCPALSIVLTCWCRRRSLIWVCLIVLFAVRKHRVRVNVVVWLTEGKSVPGVCSIRVITEWTPPSSMNGHLNHFVAARNTRVSASR